MFKGYIFLQFYCVFSTVNFRSNTARGKTSQQHEKDNASCIREGNIKMACHPPYCRSRICPPQRCIPRCPLLTIWLATFPSTISLHLWLTFHSQACTNLHLWWIPFICHIELRDITAGFLTETSHNVRIEPPLQPLTGEYLTLGSENREDGARLNIAADNFWGRVQN